MNEVLIMYFIVLCVSALPIYVIIDTYRKVKKEERYERESHHRAYHQSRSQREGREEVILPGVLLP